MSLIIERELQNKKFGAKSGRLRVSPSSVTLNLLPRGNMGGPKNRHNNFETYCTKYQLF